MDADGDPSTAAAGVPPVDADGDPTAGADGDLPARARGSGIAEDAEDAGTAIDTVFPFGPKTQVPVSTGES
ncbi:hypothetical protein Slala05_05900 [Streptomyces lavendulae subsp. lavendulae]|nr:hypothetical protein Slala05_05900 [Streptomyces lavendulae subsp. lavendulae]